MESEETKILRRLDLLNEKLDILHNSVEGETDSRERSITASNRATSVIGSLLTIGLVFLGFTVWNNHKNATAESKAACNRGNELRLVVNNLQEGTASLEAMIEFTINGVTVTPQNQELLDQVKARLSEAKAKIDGAVTPYRDCEHL